MPYCPNCQNMVGPGAPICPYCNFDLSLVPASAVQPGYAQPPMMSTPPPQPQPQVQPYGIYQQQPPLQPAPQPQYYPPAQAYPPQPQPQPQPYAPSQAAPVAKAGVSGKLVIAAIVVVVIVIVAVLAASMYLAPSGKKGDGDSDIPTKDTTPPTVISVVPARGATNVDPMPVFTITWSEPMFQSTGTEGALNVEPYEENGFCGGDYSVWLTNTTLQVTYTYYDGPLTGGVTYNASIRWPNLYELKDLAGNYAVSSLPDYIVYEWTFTVKKTTSTDTTPPRVIATIPADGAYGVGSTPSFTIIWSEPMYQSSDTEGALNLEPYGENGFCGADASEWTSSTTVVITSTYAYGGLNSGVLYNASVRWPNLYELKDLAGNYAESDDIDYVVYGWEFTA